MFNCIGRKIKLMAKLLFWIGEVCLMLGGFAAIVDATAMGDTGTAIALLLYLTVSVFGLWGIVLLVYGFGHLVDMVALIADTRTDNVLEAFEEEYQRRKRENDL